MSEKIARKIMTGSAIGNIPVHLSFDEEQHQLTAPDGLELDIETLFISGYSLGTPSIGQPSIFIYLVDKSIVLPAGLSGSYFWCAVFPTLPTSFSIMKQSVGEAAEEIGTITFNTASLPTIVFAEEQWLIPGDILLIATPSELNGIADLAWTMSAKVMPQPIITPAEYFSYIDNGDGTCVVDFNLPSDYDGDIVIPPYIDDLLVVGLAEVIIPTEAIRQTSEESFSDSPYSEPDLLISDMPGAYLNHNRALYLPASLESIPNHRFSNLGIRKLVFYNAKQVKTAQAGHVDTTVFMPVPVAQSQLKFIGERALAFNLLTDTELPPMLEEIGAEAFRGNSLSGLLVLPPSLHDTVDAGVVTQVSVGDKAFAQNQLSEVHLSPFMRKISSGAFMANQITIFGIPHPVTGELSLGEISEIGARAFYFNALGANHTSEDAFLLPGTVAQLGTEAFAFNQIKKVIIEQWGDGMTSVPYGAFRDNEIDNIILSDFITSIEDYAFCNNLLGSGENQLFAIDPLQRYVRDNITSIGRFAFAGNIWSSLYLPENIVSVGEGAFDYNIISHVVLTNDTQIALYKNVFCQAHSKLPDEWLDRISAYNSISEIKMSRISCPPVSELTLEGNVTTVAAGAFDFTDLVAFTDLTPIHFLTLGGLLRTIEANAFRDQSLKTLILSGNLESIGENAFADNLIDSLSLNPGIISIKSGAFERNLIVDNALTPGVLTLPPGISELGEAAFRNNRIASITLANTITSIEPEVFADNKLVSLEIPSYIVSIEQGAFRNNLLTSLNLDNATSLATIGDAAFAGNRLTSLNIPSMLTAIGEASTQNARVWDETTSMWLAPTEGLVRGAFEDNNITSLSLNNANSLIKIGTAAFKGNQLTSIALPANLIIVGDEAFEANNISGLDMANASSLLVISWHAFKDNSLSNLNLKCHSFNTYAFANNPVASVVLAEVGAFLMMDGFGGYTSNGSLHASWINAVQAIYRQSPSYSHPTPEAAALAARLAQLNGFVFQDNQFGFWNAWQTYLASIEEIGEPVQSNWSIV